MKLMDICNINMGQSPDSSSYNEDQKGIPFFQGNADFGERYPCTRIWCSKPTKIANVGDILISVRAPIGAMNIANQKCCIGRGLAALTVDTESCDEIFLWYALSSKVSELQLKGTGSTFKAINKQVLQDIEIPVPTLAKQKHISCILDKLTDLINKRKQQLQKLDELVKARFVEMFGDPEINNKKFDVVLGEKIFKLSNGKFVPEDERRNSGIPVYGGNGISWYTEDILYEKDTIVVGRVGYQSGNVHLVRGPVWISDNAMYISDLYDNEFELPFLYALMEQIDFTRYQDAGDLKKITQKPFMKMRYIRPPKELQIKYISFVNEVSILKTAIKNSLDKLELLKKALMQEYFG